MAIRKSLKLTLPATSRPVFASAPAAVTILLAAIAFMPRVALAGKCTPAIPQSGDVLIAGGGDASSNPSKVLEFFDPSSGTFSNACALKTARDEPFAVVVQSGHLANQILIVGGETSKKGKLSHPKTSESYNPSTGKIAKGPKLPSGIEDAAEVELGNGMAMFAGGAPNETSGFETPSNLAVLFNPASGRFVKVTGTMAAPREYLSGAPISCACADNGKALIVGGANDNGVLSDAEIFDPASMTFTSITGMNAAREFPAVTALSDGTILISGGNDPNGESLNTAEIYDPATRTFTLTTALKGSGTDMNSSRVLQTSTLLNDGTVLIAGGEQDSAFVAVDYLKSAEIYDPATAKFTAAAHLMVNTRSNHSATLIANSGTALDGQVLIAGGMNNAGVLSDAEVFNPAGETFTATAGSMRAPHEQHAAALIP